MCNWEKRIFQNLSEKEFEDLALELFRFQYAHNSVYRTYCRYLEINPEEVSSFYRIPFLPVSFFKTHRINTTDFEAETVFTSSGTSGMETARHYVKSLKLYEKAFMESFRYFYGDPQPYTFLALLPSYLEREGSSLIYMVDNLIRLSDSPHSGFYLYDHQTLYDTLCKTKKEGRKTILFGVSYALLNFSEQFPMDYPGLIIFETGGMKGRREELVKEDLHGRLKKAFGVNEIHSEYGMCELLSQAYSGGQNIFFTPPWMKLLLRDEKDPFFVSDNLSSGIINVIDLANVYSSAFIATDDLGKKNGPGTEITGRVDYAGIRGCNLLVI